MEREVSRRRGARHGCLTSSHGTPRRSSTAWRVCDVLGATADASMDRYRQPLHMTSTIMGVQTQLLLSHRETEEKARQQETKLGASAQTRHMARLRNAKRSHTKHPKPIHGARARPFLYKYCIKMHIITYNNIDLGIPAHRRLSSALPFVPCPLSSFGRFGAPAVSLLGSLADSMMQLVWRFSAWVRGLRIVLRGLSPCRCCLAGSLVPPCNILCRPCRPCRPCRRWWFEPMSCLGCGFWVLGSAFLCIA
jgi:hypothetical protein